MRSLFGLLTISSVSYGIAFVLCPYCFWFIFIFLIPVYYLLINDKLTYLHGFYWGLCSWFIHLVPYIIFFIENFGIMYGLLPVILIIYLSLYAGLWFVIMRFAYYRLHTYPLLLVIFFTLCSVLYFNFINDASCWIFGTIIGYPLAYPLLPLAELPGLFYFLGVLGSDIFLLLLILFQISWAFFIRTQKKQYIVLSVFCSMPYAFGLAIQFHAQDHTRPPLVDQLGYVSPPDHTVFNHPLDLAQEIDAQIQRLLEKKSQIRCVLMPESTYPYALNIQKDVMSLWHTNSLAHGVALIIGSTRLHEGSKFNSVFLVRDGKIQGHYDKRRLVPFVEYVPPFLCLLKIGGLFLGPNMAFSCGQNSQEPLEIIKGCMIEPCICAELFLGKGYSHSPKAGMSQAAFMFDTAFSCPWMSKLLKLYSRYKVQLTQKDLLYIGYRGACCLAKSGLEYEINC